MMELGTRWGLQFLLAGVYLFIFTALYLGDDQEIAGVYAITIGILGVLLSLAIWKGI